MQALRRRLIVASALLPAAALAQSALTKARPIRIVVGFAPGTPPEVVARILAESMSRSTGLSFMVENRPGAGGTVAADAVAKSAPDGHTLIVSTLSHSVNAILLPNARDHPLRDFAPVSLLAMLPLTGTRKTTVIRMNRLRKLTIATPI